MIHSDDSEMRNIKFQV